MKKRMLRPSKVPKIKKIRVLNDEETKSVYSALLENENTQLFLRTIQGQENYENAMKLMREVKQSEEPRSKVKEIEIEDEDEQDEDDEDLED